MTLTSYDAGKAYGHITILAFSQPTVASSVVAVSAVRLPDCDHEDNDSVNLALCWATWLLRAYSMHFETRRFSADIVLRLMYSLLLLPVASSLVRRSSFVSSIGVLCFARLFEDRNHGLKVVVHRWQQQRYLLSAITLVTRYYDLHIRQSHTLLPLTDISTNTSRP